MAYVNGAQQNIGSGTVTSIALGSYTPGAAGNSFVVGCFLKNANNNLAGLGISDTINTYTLLSGSPFSDSNIAAHGVLYVWTCSSCSASTVNPTVSWSGNSTGFNVLTLTEYSGRNTSTLIDFSGSGTATNGQSHNFGNNALTTSLAGDDLWMLGIGSTNNSTFTGGASWTIDETSNTAFDALTQYQQNVAIGNYTPQYSTSQSEYALGVFLALAQGGTSYTQNPIFFNRRNVLYFI